MFLVFTLNTLVFWSAEKQPKIRQTAINKDDAVHGCGEEVCHCAAKENKYYAVVNADRIQDNKYYARYDCFLGFDCADEVFNAICDCRRADDYANDFVIETLIENHQEAINDQEDQDDKNTDLLQYAPDVTAMADDIEKPFDCKSESDQDTNDDADRKKCLRKYQAKTFNYQEKTKKKITVSDNLKNSDKTVHEFTNFFLRASFHYLYYTKKTSKRT